MSLYLLIYASAITGFHIGLGLYYFFRIVKKGHRAKFRAAIKGDR